MTQTSDLAKIHQGITVPQDFLNRISVEHVVYALVLMAAAIIRLVDLSLVPLSPIEAQEALAVLDFWKPGDVLIEVVSPAYFTLTAFLTQVLGFNDTVMRLVPALFGIGIVVLPWFLRHKSGRLGALVTAILLAVSPVQILAARSTGGDSIAVFCGFLLFISWLRFQESAERRWFLAVAFSMALGLTSSPIFYGFLLTLIVAWLAQLLIGPLIVPSDSP
jgi:predicted membrane-bound mannosyltransferase